MPLEHERSYLPIVQSPLVQPEKDEELGDIEENRLDSHTSASPSPPKLHSDDPEFPQFRRFTQSTNIELFYDLFFVANLTVFTYEHEVNSGESLKQYVGFFCIIWFTWYQVSLYDVRFGMDSVVERVCKAVQFLVMIGFAVCGPEFNPGEETEDDADGESPSLDYFKALTLVLMISRLVLVVQYLQAIWFARSYKKVLLPMSLLIGTYFVAAMVYLGLFWTFHLNANGENHTYIVWYVIAILETILATSVSVVWRNLSFQGTHLVERMSLLTLIIFGEGAIGIARACQYIVYEEGQFDFTGSVAAAIVCAVLNLYFMYMIYFDWIHEDLFGTIRQQIWSFLHFPLHVALVLAVEGASQCITWTAAVRRNTALLHEFEEWQNDLQNFTVPLPPERYEEAAAALNRTAVQLLDRSLGRSGELLATAQGIGYTYQTNNSAIPTIANGAEDLSAAGNAFDWLIGILFNTVFKIAGFTPPPTDAETSETLEYLQDPIDFSEYAHDYWREQSQDNIEKAWTVFELTYVYFYVTTGVFLILCCVLAWLNRGRKTKLFVSRLLWTSLVGLGIALLSTMSTTGTVANFVLGAWLLPTVTLCLFAIVVMNAVKLSPRVPKIARIFGRRSRDER